MTSQEVWITGVGLVSSLGEGADTHWQTLSTSPQNAAIVDVDSFAPYPIHPLYEVEWEKHISRRDKRQMDLWQQLGTYSAGVALEDAGLKDDIEQCATMDMIVAAGGGERDVEVDTNVMENATGKPDQDKLLIETLYNDLRPTLFLAQLSNLLAGNISIVHKVTGSSRTFMGEESAGISAIQTACARIASGQSTHTLVGGAYSCQRSDMMLSFELDHLLWDKAPTDVWSRAEQGGGIMCGSVGAFLVLESAEHAKARGKTPYAKIAGVVADHGNRTSEAFADRLEGLLSPLIEDESKELISVLSGASGTKQITDAEQALLTKLLPDNAKRAYGSLLGHGLEAQFPAGIILAAIALSNESFYPAFSANEIPSKSTPESVLVSTLGSWRGEGFAKVTKL